MSHFYFFLFSLFLYHAFETENDSSFTSGVNFIDFLLHLAQILHLLAMVG